MPKPTIYLIAGCNGAGKTTFAKEFLPSIGVVRFLNADEIARGLSPLRPEVVAFKAGRLLLSELREQIARRETFALESTLSGRTYVNVFEKAKEQRGYWIELHFVWIPKSSRSDPPRPATSQGRRTSCTSRRHQEAIFSEYRASSKRLRTPRRQMVPVG
jgi:predicted ABC-type ATPase